jgi:hypothetical protein
VTDRRPARSESCRIPVVASLVLAAAFLSAILYHRSSPPAPAAQVEDAPGNLPPTSIHGPAGAMFSVFENRMIRHEAEIGLLRERIEALEAGRPAKAGESLD